MSNENTPAKSSDKTKFYNLITEQSNYQNLRNFFTSITMAGYILLITALFIGIVMLIKSSDTYERSLSNLYFSNGLTLIFLSILGIITLHASFKLSILLIDIADSVNHSAYVNHATYLLASKRSKDA